MIRALEEANGGVMEISEERVYWGEGASIKKKGKRPGGKKRSGIDIHTKQEMELGVGETIGYRIQKRKQVGRE